MKFSIETDAYSVCQRCERGAAPGDPLIKMGQFVEWVTLHKSCFDILTKEVDLLCMDWRAKQVFLGKLPKDLA